MKNRFFDRQYINHNRWESYWTQIDSVLKTKPESVLEIGCGNGVVDFVLKNFGTNTTTLDIDPSLKPKVVGDVRKIPFKNGSFDTVLCSQVLEHLPFSDFSQSIAEICRVTKKYVVLSLPEPYGTYVYFGLKLIPFLPKIEFAYKLILFLPKLTIGSSHKWEIGRENYSYKKIIEIINKNGLVIEKSFCPKENLYHRFLILRKI